VSRELLTIIIDLCEVPADWKAVLLVLARFCHNDGTKAWPAVSLIADLARMSRRNVIYVLKALAGAGLIVTTRRQKGGKRQSNAYALILPALLKLKHYHTGAKCTVCTFAIGAKMQETSSLSADNVESGVQAVHPKHLTTEASNEAFPQKVVSMAEHRKKPRGWQIKHCHDHGEPVLLNPEDGSCWKCEKRKPRATGFLIADCSRCGAKTVEMNAHRLVCPARVKVTA
jgi:hypothetical protein